MILKLKLLPRKMLFTPKMKTKILIILIILMLVFIGGVSAYFIFQKSSLPQSSTPPEQSSNIQQPTQQSQLEKSILSQPIPSGPVSTASSVNVSANVKPLFGTMLAFNINDAMGDPSAGVPGIIGALQKGWTEFRKDDSAYQNLKSNLKKLIQDRTKLVKTTGFSFDREVVGYFTWNVIEPKKGQFDWELTDIYVQAASNAGVKISAVILPFASWDQKNTSPLANCNALDFAYYDYKAGSPNDLAKYENFLTKIVERYKDNVAVWEIGNEVEGSCGGYKNNPQEYVALLKISYETIKKVDSRAMVVNGGALEIDKGSEISSFWQQFFTLGGDQYIDYFNLHYNTGRSPGAKLDSGSLQENLAFFNDLMDKSAQGGKRPLYLTEFGISSGSPSSQSGQPVPVNDKCGDSVCDDFEKANPNACPKDCQISIQKPIQGEDSQAASYFKDSVVAFANGVNLVFIDLVGSDNDAIGSSMAFDTEGQPRLFLTTLKTIESKIGGFSKVEKIADSQYKFIVGDKIIYALWSGTLPNEIIGKVKVTDIKGQKQIMDATGIKLKANQPVFIELQRQ